MPKRIRSSRLLAALACLAAFQVQADPGSFSFTTGLDYSTGKYGGTSSTTIWYLPLTGKYETDAWAFKLTVPYIRITGPGDIIREIGTLGSAGERTTQSGTGDVVASATYNLSGGRGASTVVDLTGKVKFGTADDTKGLGTGKNDYAVQLDGFWTVSRFTALGTVGYKVLGDPPGSDLRNVFYGTLGFSYKFTPQTSAGLIADVREKTTQTGDRQEELTLFLSQKYSQNWKAQFYVVKGYTDSSPSGGGGAMVTYSF